jgi:hypothetical protein
MTPGELMASLGLGVLKLRIRMSARAAPLERLADSLYVAEKYARGQLRRLAARTTPSLPAITACDGETLSRFVLEASTPWHAVSAPAVSAPGMITDEEARYFYYIGRFYSGEGEVVELGPWLGKSTSFIAQGLRANPRFSGRQLWVFDDFVWRPSWMSQHYPEADQPGRHASFRHLFDRYTAPFKEMLRVERRRFTDHDGNEQVPLFQWSGSPVELLFVDCGRTLAANEAWYEALHSSFIPGRTLIVLQDWGTHREVPPRWYNQMHEFVAQKGEALDLVHELRRGSAATFLFRGDSSLRPVSSSS